MAEHFIHHVICNLLFSTLALWGSVVLRGASSLGILFSVFFLARLHNASSGIQKNNQ